MSGFEIAGVVLGSIPLIISALEHYSDGVSTIKSMQKYESAFAYLHASFVSSLTIYRNSCEELLSPLDLPDSQLFELLEDIDGRAWASAALDARVRTRLGSNYLPLKSSVKQLNKKIELFAHKLKLEKDFRAPWISPLGVVDEQARDRFFKNPINRIKGGFNFEKYKKLLSSLDEDINRIVALTSGAIALEPLRLDRKRKASSDYWTQFRQHAERLHEVLYARWSASCGCQCSHYANLRLEVRREPESDQSPTFKLLFCIENKVTTNSPWYWHAAEIKPSNSGNPAILRNVPSIPTILVQPVSLRRENLWDHCRLKATKIDNLCHALISATTSPSTCCIGVLHDSAGQHHIHSIVLPKPKTSSITVGDLLINHTQPGFHVKEKCSLALTLASAVLQLHNTSWLGETWKLSDIHIVDRQTLLSDQPYVSTKFVSNSTTLSVAPVQKTPNIFIKNSIVFALGVALLEISYGNVLETFETPADLEQGKRMPWTDCMIAYRLTERLSSRELPNFADAARRCIHCSFDSSVYSLDNDDFREKFYQGVIVPLQEDYNYAMGVYEKP